MKKTKLTRSLMAAVSIVALSAVMYGCVHSGSGTTVSNLNLMADGTGTVAPGTYSVDSAPAALAAALATYEGPTSAAAGGMLTIGGYTFTCGDSPCTVTLSEDEETVTVTGTITVAKVMAEPVEPDPDPVDVERKAINDAIAAAQTAVAAVNDASTDEMVAAADTAIAAAMKAITDATRITAGEVAAFNARLATVESQLTAAKASRTMTMDLADQRMAITDAIAAATTAVGAVDDDSDDAEVTAAENAITAATAAIAAASHIPNSEAAAERAKVAALQTSLDAAKKSRQMALDEAARMRQAQMDEEERRNAQLMAITSAIAAARTAVAAVNDTSPQSDVDAANAAIANARAKIAEAADVADDVKDGHTASVTTLEMSLTSALASRKTAMDTIAQRDAITGAIAMAKTAVAAVGDDSDDAAVMAADDAVAAAKQAIADATNVPDAEKAANNREVAALETQLASAKESRTMAMNAAADKERMEALAAARKKVTDAIDAARTAVAAVDDESTDEEVMAADTAVAAAKTAIDGAAEISDDEKTGHRSAVSVLETQLVDAKESRTAAMAAKVEEMRLAEEKKARDAVTKAAGTKLAAINAEGEQTTDAGLGGDGITIGTDEDNYSLDIERDRDGTTVTVTVHGATDDDDEKFVQAMDLGGGTNMQTRTMKADDDGNVMQEVAVVTTDIEAPMPTAFAKVHELDVRADGETPTDDDPADSRDISDAELDGTVEDDAAILKLVMSSRFTAGTAATLTFGGDDPADDDDSAFKASGTYDGARGMYMCAGGATDCTVTLDKDGKITGMSDGWIFTPNSGVTVDVADPDYLNWGFWLKKTTDEDGVVTYNEVETFAGSNVEASGDVSSVEGTATYSGGATGVYVHHRHTEGGGKIASSTAGHFTADASLMANFGGTSVAEDDHFTLTGTIDNFMLSGGEEQDWSVALKADITESTGITAEGGTAMGGNGDGSFSATFHGSTGDAGVVQPSAVVGEFNAGFSNGAVAGAFGATKDAD